MNQMIRGDYRATRVNNNNINEIGTVLADVRKNV